jgi:hypothetical protein
MGWYARCPSLQDRLKEGGLLSITKLTVTAVIIPNLLIIINYFYNFL